MSGPVPRPIAVAFAAVGLSLGLVSCGLAQQNSAVQDKGGRRSVLGGLFGSRGSQAPKRGKVTTTVTSEIPELRSKEPSDSTVTLTGIEPIEDDGNPLPAKSRTSATSSAATGSAPKAIRARQKAAPKSASSAYDGGAPQPYLDVKPIRVTDSTSGASTFEPPAMRDTTPEYTRCWKANVGKCYSSYQSLGDIMRCTDKVRAYCAKLYKMYPDD